MEQSEGRVYSYEEILNMEKLISELKTEINFKNKQIDFLQELIKNNWRKNNNEN